MYIKCILNLNDRPTCVGARIKIAKSNWRFLPQITMLLAKKQAIEKLLSVTTAVTEVSWCCLQHLRTRANLSVGTIQKHRLLGGAFVYKVYFRLELPSNQCHIKIDKGRFPAPYPLYLSFDRKENSDFPNDNN